MRCREEVTMKKSLCLGLLLGLAALSVNVAQAKGENEMKRAFVDAVTPIARREACLRFIDAGLLKRGVSMDEIRDLFGSRLWVTGGETPDGLAIAIVGFEDTPTGSNAEDGDAGNRGWYLVLHFSHEKKVVFYYLSNLQK
jgi:hypothetical protein